MVAKDIAGSQQAQLEQSILEKKNLYALAAAKNKDVKMPSPQKLMNEVVKDFKYQPHQMHCLKALLEKNLSYKGCHKAACLANGCTCDKPWPITGFNQNAVTELFSNHIDQQYNLILTKAGSKLINPATLFIGGGDSDDSDDGEDSDAQDTFYQHNGGN